MKCFICQKNEATILFKQVSDGSTNELHLCKKCAAQVEFSMEPAMSLSEALFPLKLQNSSNQSTNKKCTECEMTINDFQRLSRLGCPACYTCFAEELVPIISTMHKASTHKGKMPALETINKKVQGLQQSMEKAIAIQDFEEAAILRDKISELKNDN